MNNSTLIAHLDVVGLNRSGTFTCKFDNDLTWIDSGLDLDRFIELFKWAKNDRTFWKERWIAEIQCEGLSDNGYPINGKVIGIKTPTM